MAEIWSIIVRYRRRSWRGGDVGKATTWRRDAGGGDCCTLRRCCGNASARRISVAWRERGRSDQLLFWLCQSTAGRR